MGWLRRRRLRRVIEQTREARREARHDRRLARLALRRELECRTSDWVGVLDTPDVEKSRSFQTF